jgi:hypothetical protein
MSAIFLPFLYPVVTPFVAYYTLKYATNVAIDITIDKTKNIIWHIVTYPFNKNKSGECIRCKCEKCRKENCENLDCQQGCEIIDLTNVKEKTD